MLTAFLLATASLCLGAVPSGQHPANDTAAERAADQATKSCDLKAAQSATFASTAGAYAKIWRNFKDSKGVELNGIPGRMCGYNVSNKSVDVLFQPDGSEACVPVVIPEDYVINAHVLVPVKCADEYQISAVAGERAAELPIHGLVVTNEVTVLINQDPRLEPKAATALGPFHAKTVKISIRTSFASGEQINVTHEYPVGLRYPFDLGVSILATVPEPQTFELKNKILVKTSADVIPDYYVVVHWFFLNGLTGRYFDGVPKDALGLGDHFALTFGVGISAPAKKLLLGPTWVPVDGLGVTLAWLPSVRQEVDAGAVVGQPFGGDDAPVHERWTLLRFGVGISITPKLFSSLKNALSGS